MSFIENLFSLKNKVAIITGAASGIGQHAALIYAQAGAQVVIVDINVAGLNQTAQNLKALGFDAIVQAIDITNEDQVNGAVTETIKKFGHIDILLNCAAIIKYQSFLSIELQDWQNTFNVDLIGTWLMAKTVINHMIEKKITGSIINIASSLAYRTQKDLVVYNTIKAGVAHFTKTMGAELVEHNIRINAIAPGFTLTNMIKEFLASDDGKHAIQSVPFKRAAELDELNGVLLLLASNASSYISGTLIKVDGGLAFDSIEI